jgi:hypothetical protein
MKQSFIIVSFLLITSISIGCKAKKETKSTTNSITSESSTTGTTTSVEDEKTIQYRLVISFISKGAGIDSKLNAAITAYVSAHPKKPATKIISWGREGENDHCFLLKELTKTEQVEFIAEIKKIIGSSDMVLLTENAKSAHKGR